MKHPFELVNYNGEDIEIDKDIVSLLQKMWKLGINTTNSCQAHCSFACKHKNTIVEDEYGSYYDIFATEHCFTHIWLAFPSCKDVEKLYNIVAEYVPRPQRKDSMYSKMNCELFVQTGQTDFKQPLDGWSFNFFMANEGVYGSWPTFNCDKNDFVIQPQITFPRSHMEYIETRLEKKLNG